MEKNERNSDLLSYTSPKLFDVIVNFAEAEGDDGGDDCPENNVSTCVEDTCDSYVEPCSEDAPTCPGDAPCGIYDCQELCGAHAPTCPDAGGTCPEDAGCEGLACECDGPLGQCGTNACADHWCGNDGCDTNACLIDHTGSWGYCPFDSCGTNICGIHACTGNSQPGNVCPVDIVHFCDEYLEGTGAL